MGWIRQRMVETNRVEFLLASFGSMQDPFPCFSQIRISMYPLFASIQLIDTKMISLFPSLSSASLAQGEANSPILPRSVQQLCSGEHAGSSSRSVNCTYGNCSYASSTGKQKQPISMLTKETKSSMIKTDQFQPPLLITRKGLPHDVDRLACFFVLVTVLNLSDHRLQLCDLRVRYR